MLSPSEVRGQALKRYVRSAAALQGVFDDTTLGEAVGRSRIAVGQWWRGSRPEPDAIRRLAEVTGLSTDELTRFVYYDGPPPTLPNEAPGPVDDLAGELDAATERLAKPSEPRPRARREPTGGR